MERFDFTKTGPEAIVSHQVHTQETFALKHNAEVETSNAEVEETILSATNASPKCATLLLIPSNGEFISLKELYKQFHQIYQDTEFETIEEATVLAYCRSFERNGVVVRRSLEYIGIKKTAEFSLTNFGKRLVKPSAALGLHFEFFRGLSLFRIFGSARNANSGQHSAPYHRANILRFLDQKGGGWVRESEIVQELGAHDSLISRSLIALEKADVIKRRSGNKMSLMAIDHKGRIVVEEYLNLLSRFIDGEEAATKYITAEVMPEVIGRLPDFAKELLPLYYYHSHSHKMREHKENMIWMLALIATAPQGRTARELSDFLNLDYSTINHDVNLYVRQGRIKVLIRGGENHYYT